MVRMKSIISDEKRCFVCGRSVGLERHHILKGTAWRKQSEKYGLTVWLCFDHHRGKHGVHNGNTALDFKLMQIAQERFEEIYGHDKFMEVFRRNFLNVNG